MNKDLKIVKLYPIPEQMSNNFMNYKIKNNIFLINSIKNKYLPITENILKVINVLKIMIYFVILI